MAKKSLAEKVKTLQSRLERLQAKHAQWNPDDSKSMQGWMKQLDSIKHQAEFAEQPTIKKFIKYVTDTDAEIKEVLLNQKELKESERRILMEKREFMKAWLTIFVPSETAIAAMETEINYQLRTDK